jgi:DNA-binding CsgD family transcriptional regulator
LPSLYAHPLAPSAPALPTLTDREHEVLLLVAAGLSDPEIAKRLVLSSHTVHRHVANIRTKLRQPSRAATAAYAGRLNLTLAAENATAAIAVPEGTAMFGPALDSTRYSRPPRRAPPTRSSNGRNERCDRYDPPGILAFWIAVVEGGAPGMVRIGVRRVVLIPRVVVAVYLSSPPAFATSPPMPNLGHRVLLAWGRTDYGQLGDGTVLDRHTPVQVKVLPDSVREVSAGYEHTLALRDGREGRRHRSLPQCRRSARSPCGRRSGPTTCEPGDATRTPRQSPMGVSIPAPNRRSNEMTKLRRMLAVTLIAAAVLGVLTVPAKAATEIAMTFSVNRTTSGLAMYDMRVFVVVPMNRIDAEGYLWNNVRIEVRIYGDDAGTDPVIYGPHSFRRVNGLVATDFGVVLDLRWQEPPGGWMNEDDSWTNRGDEIYAKATWVDGDGGTISTTSSVITGLF